MPLEDSLTMKYFVLSPTSKDPHHSHASRAAMLAYADAIDVTHPSLADSLRMWVQRLDDQQEVADATARHGRPAA